MLFDYEWECSVCHHVNKNDLFICSYCQNSRRIPETREGRKLMNFIIQRNERYFSNANALDIPLPKTINTFLLNSLYPGLGFIYTKHYRIIPPFLAFVFLFIYQLPYNTIALYPLGAYAVLLQSPPLILIYFFLNILLSFIFTSKRRTQLLKPFGIHAFSRYIKSNSLLQESYQFPIY